MNRTRREFLEMVRQDDVAAVAGRLKDVIAEFCQRADGRAALTDALGSLLG
jgi:hypothetical protein